MAESMQFNKEVGQPAEDEKYQTSPVKTQNELIAGAHTQENTRMNSQETLAK